MFKNIFKTILILFLLTMPLSAYTIRDSLTIIKTGDADTTKITNERMDIDSIYAGYINVDSIWAKYLNIYMVDTARALRFETNDDMVSGLLNYNVEDTLRERIGSGNIFYDSFVTLNTSNWDIDTTGTAYVHASDSLEIYTLDKPDTAIVTSKKLLKDSTEVTFRVCSFGAGNLTAPQHIYFKNLGQDILLSSLMKDMGGVGLGNFIEMKVYDKNGQLLNFVRDTCDGNIEIKFTRFMDTVYSYINDSLVAKTDYDLYSGNTILDSNYIRFKFVGDDEFPYFYIDDFSIDTFVIAIDTILPDNEIKMFHKDSVVFVIKNNKFQFVSPYNPDTTRFAYQNPWFNVYNFADTLSDSNIIWNCYNEDMTTLAVPNKITIINIFGGKWDTMTIHALTLVDDTLSRPLILNFYGNPISSDTFYMQDISNRKLIISGHREFIVNNYNGCLNVFNTRSIILNNSRFYNKRGSNKTAYALQLGGAGTENRKIEINDCYIESDSTVLGFTGALNFSNLVDAKVDIKNTTIYAHRPDASEGAVAMIRYCDNTVINFYDCTLISDFDCLNGVIDGGPSANNVVNVYNSRIIAKNNQLGQMAVLCDWGLDVRLYDSYIETQTGGFWTYRYTGSEYSNIELHNCYVKTRHYALRSSYGSIKAYNTTFYSTDTSVENDTGHIWITPAGDNAHLGTNFHDTLIVDGCTFIGHGIKPILFSKAVNDDLAHDSLLARVYINIKNTKFISDRDTLIYTSTYTRDSFNIDLKNIEYNSTEMYDATYDNLDITEDTTRITNALQIGSSSTLITKTKIVVDSIVADVISIPKVDSALYADSAFYLFADSNYVVADLAVDTLDADSINTRTAVVSDTLTIGDNKVYDDGDYIVFNSRIAQRGLGRSTYLGDSAGFNDNLTDKKNVGIGFQALYSDTSGSANVGIGFQSLYHNTTGYDNVGIGYQSLYNDTSGYTNVAIGVEALLFNTSGYANVAIGYEGMNSNTTGNNNTAIGVGALYENTSGTYNAAIGYGALYTNTTGSSNTAIGISAGKFITGVFSNEIAYQSTYIGANTKAYAVADTNEIVIGSGAIGAGSNTVTIGHTDIIKTVLRGKVEADSIKSDSIYTEELVANNITTDTVKVNQVLKTDEIQSIKDPRISLISMTKIPKGRLKEDTVFILNDTITVFKEGDIFTDTSNQGAMIYTEGEWQVFGYRIRYVEAYINAIDSLPSISQNTWTALTCWTQGYTNNMTLTGDSIIIAGESGRYKVDYSLSIKSTVANHEYLFGISKNNNAPDVWTRAFQKCIANEWHSLSWNCILDLTSTDTLRVVVLDTTGGSSIYFKYGNMVLEEIESGTR